MNSANAETYPLCERALDGEETVVVQEKGAEGINRASIKRSVKVRVEAGTCVHKTYQVNHLNKKDIAIASSKGDSPRPVKRSAYVSLGPYDSRTHCGTVTTKKVTKGFFMYRQMHLFKLYWSIAKPEGTSGAQLFKARLNILVVIFTQQTVYHQSCSINFRTMQNIPRQFTLAESTKQ